MRRILALISVSVLMVALTAMPALAQRAPVVTGGLVNVTIVDAVTLEVVGTQVLPIAVAANVCDVDVAVLAQQFKQGGDAECTAIAENNN